jgi:hypothetical protein
VRVLIHMLYYSVHCVFSAKYGLSKHGKPLIIINEERFRKMRTVGLKTYWYCASHGHKGCRAVLHTQDNSIIMLKNNHNHAPTVRKKYTRKNANKAQEILGWILRKLIQSVLFKSQLYWMNIDWSYIFM